MMNPTQITNVLDEQSAAFLDTLEQGLAVSEEASAEQEWNMNLIHQLPSAIIIEPDPDEDAKGDDDDQGDDNDDQ